jgi:uncharacterized membrane protein (DUF373 family)
MTHEVAPMSPSTRAFVAQAFSVVEDVAYAGLGIILAITAFGLLLSTFKSFVAALLAHSLGVQVVNLLDQILLVLLIIELLYTVQVSFREHGLVAEPFLVVALIAVVRRILVLIAEVPKLPQAGEVPFRQALVELALLAVMVVILVGSLIVFQRHEHKTGHRT